jgi:hypothetical protein
MLKAIVSSLLVFLIPTITLAATIHGVDVPNECLASLNVKPNSFISNFSGFSSWRPLEGYRCDAVETVRAKLFIEGIARPDSEIKFAIQGVQLLINELDQKRIEVEKDIADSRPSSDAAGDILSNLIWAKVGIVQTVIGCFGGGPIGCGISAIASGAGIVSTSDAIVKGNDAIANTKKLKDRLKETNDKLKKAKSDLGLLENLSSAKIKEGAARATKDFVEMCRLVKLNCK